MKKTDKKKLQQVEDALDAPFVRKYNFYPYPVYDKAFVQNLKANFSFGKTVRRIPDKP